MRDPVSHIFLCSSILCFAQILRCHRAGEALADSSVEFAKCFLPVPPISILLDQQLNESTNTTSDGVNKKNMYMEQTLFSATCAANDDRLILFPLEVAVRLESPLSGTSI